MHESSTIFSVMSRRIHVICTPDITVIIVGQWASRRFMWYLSDEVCIAEFLEYLR